MTRRYRAPTADGGLLAVPPLAEVPELLSRNRQRLATMALTWGGLPLERVRQEARAEIRAATRAYHADCGEPLPPETDDDGLLLAGHQPELFHPGVWVKNFALHTLARSRRLTPINLVVDNDTAKSAKLRLPVVSADPAQVTTASLPYDHWAGEVPYEERRVLDEETFAGLPAAAAEITDAWGYRPLLADFWPEVMRHRQRTPLLGERLVAGRRTFERRWGCHNGELPVSRLAGTVAFARFVLHWLSDHPRFGSAYNDCLHAYRRERRLRSRHHPVPDLAIGDDGWAEVPFWAWRTDETRRSRLFVRTDATGYRLRLDAGPVVAELPRREPERAWERLREQGVKIRPRALTLTLFARLALAEAFIHGIGGGTYDELTDAIAQRCFGIVMPDYLVLSATLRLPLPTFASDAETVRQLRRHERDLYWNPQRHLPNPTPEARQEIEEKRHVIESGRPATARERRSWFARLRSLTDHLRPWVADERQVTEKNVRHAQAEESANLLMQQRDWSMVLHSGERLQQLLTNNLSH